jgi:hypothetical protein
MPLAHTRVQAVEQSARQRLSELQAQAQEQGSQLQAAQQVVDAIKAERDALLKQAEVGGWAGMGGGAGRGGVGAKSTPVP